MRHGQERRVGELRDYAKKQLIGVSTGEGSPQRVDTAQNTARAGHRRPRGARARCPHAITEKHTALHYWLFYTSRKKGALCYWSEGRGGGLSKSRCRNGTPRQKGGAAERSMHKEALGDLNQALATRGRTRGLGSDLQREKWHLARR